MINSDDLKKLSIEDFHYLLEYIGYELLRTKLIEIAKKLQENSQYYIGRRGNGSFWKGFRSENLPQFKVRQFYDDEVRKNISSLNLNSDFEQLLLKRIGVVEIDESAKTKIFEIKDIRVVDILKQVFSLNMDISYEMFVNKVNELSDKYGKELLEQKNKYLNEIDEVNKEKIDKLDTLKNNYEIRLAEEREKNRELIRQNSNLLESIKRYDELEKMKKEEFIDKCFNAFVDQKSIKEIISDNNICKRENLENILIKMLEQNYSVYKSGQNLSKWLVLEYVLCKMMEE